MKPLLYFWLSEATIATAATTAATYFFTPSMLPSGRGVVQFDIRLTGTDLTPANITRVRVKAGSTVIIDADCEDSIQAWLQRITTGTFDLADADIAFSLPFYDPRNPDTLQKYTGQFPYFLGAPQIEITLNATPAAGTLGVSAVIVDANRIPMTHYHSFISSRLEVAASSTNARQNVNLPPGAQVKGIVINTTGLDRLQLTLDNDIQGLWTGVSMLVSNRNYNSDVLANPTCCIIEASGPAGISGNEWLLSTAAGWAGVANEGGIWAVHPVQAA